MGLNTHLSSQAIMDVYGHYFKSLSYMNPSSDLILNKAGGLFLTSILITFGAPFRDDVFGALFGIKTMTLKRDVSLK